MSAKRMLIVVLLATGLGAGAWAQLPVAPGLRPIVVEARLKQAPTATQPLIVEFAFKIAAGVHVYATADHFLKLEDKSVSGLGPATITMPAIQTIPDLLADEPGAKTQVMTGEPVIVVTRPATAPAGGPWKWEGSLGYQGCTEKSCFPPAAAPCSFSGTVGSGTAVTATPAPTVAPGAMSGEWGNRGLWLGVLAAFVAGLALSLTPCVYPMIGITVAVIGGRGASRGRTLYLTFLYVLGLALVYAVLGIVVAKLGSGAAAFLRSAWILVPVGVLFLAMGLSMFDLFTLATPSGLASRLQQVGKQDSALGVLVMGALSAFVVGPCVTGPLIGLITFVATTGDVVTGFLYFFALAWGMGAILFVAGSAAGLLPRAGGWMAAVKHAMGMVLIWAAFYFTRPLTGEVVFLAASLTCLAVGLSVIDWLRLPGEAETGVWGARLRFAVAVVVLAGASAYVVGDLYRGAADVQPGTTAGGRVDLAAELAHGQPVLLEFSAPWCAICKELERTVLAEPAVKARLGAFRVVRVNYDDNPELAQRFGIIGPPAFVFLDAQGRGAGDVIVTGEALRARLLGP